ncbi:LiaF transmembrane domain-containing protein [Serpentinicella alkaliphila]|uniref:Cell wall-active antibiotic response 4TMS protein YvqF n=1 Tax=Serpentinicella alkaliphila TaxID=1734049 RepID=A0A4R2TB68_9FIRM|nr:DUF5668 domain-containing protein [Serpentinicella alkaliphila]QUH25395.1 hypothetical protein HZR23_06220 [Serpentinicella alkaliphila]TCQ00600.1 cell wall-active antibiotic response 4TMS protein YvqF [Serpentinicella alkaliphila]
MNGRKLFGLILVALGIILMLDKVGMYAVNFAYIISNYWPMAIVLIGIFNLFDNSHSKLGSLITVTIGVLLQLKILGYFNIFNYLYLWPVILILLGIHVIFSKSDGKYKDTRDKIDSVALFSGCNTRNFSQNFKGGSVVAIFGAADIDLRDAQAIAGKEMSLDVFTLFGGVDLIVPKEWNVTVKGLPLFGGWSNKTIVSKNIESPLLKISCFVAFGGMDIKN